MTVIKGTCSYGCGDIKTDSTQVTLRFIKGQEDGVVKAEKKLKKLQDDQADLEAKLKKLQDNITENAKEQEDAAKSIEDQKQILDTLKSKRKS